MANTGRKIYQFLKEVDVATGIPTGTVKANTIGDPDYVAPVVDYTMCPIVAWEAINPYCITTQVCAAGWTLVGNVCQQETTQAATAPTGNGGSPGLAVKVTNTQWNNGGARIYAPGYSSDGSGTVAASLLVPHLWINGDSVWSTSTRNTTDSRMNAAGIWSQSTTPDNEYVGFSRKITLSAAKTVYIGIAGDNVVRITVNGTVLVTAETIDGGPNFNYWNIYPVQLSAGDNFIELYGMNLGGSAGFAAEIYDMTQDQLVAAASVNDLNILFSTESVIGQNFDLGQTQGWSCPTGWSLDMNGGSPVCKQIQTQSPSTVNTGMKGYGKRRRLTNGSPDGYEEDNTSSGGVGPYFAPVQDLINCPI